MTIHDLDAMLGYACLVVLVTLLIVPHEHNDPPRWLVPIVVGMFYVFARGAIVILGGAWGLK